MIKNLNKILVVLFAAVIFSVCIFSSAPCYLFADQNFMVQADEIQQMLHDFINNNENRFSFNSDGKGGEKLAAEYIAAQLIGFGYTEDEVKIQEFNAEFEISPSSFFQAAKTETRYSQNVVCSVASPAATQKIVVGCNYDNVYKDHLSTGAMRSGTGVAIALALCKALKSAQSLPYNIDIVFFGAGYHDYYGSTAYVSKNGLKSVAAMFNVSRIGGGSTYIYCDEVKTDLQSYLLNKGGLPMPARVPTLNVELISGYPYAHYGMFGNHSVFMGNKVKTANIFGGYYNSMNLGDLEGPADILNKDTIENMEKEYPECYNKMEKAANIILESITDSALATVLTDRVATDSILLKKWVAYIIFGVIAALALFGFYFIGGRLIKKYPPVFKRGKIAIFGVEYETLKDNEILIDIKPKSPFD